LSAFFLDPVAAAAAAAIAAPAAPIFKPPAALKTVAILAAAASPAAAAARNTTVGLIAIAKSCQQRSAIRANHQEWMQFISRSNKTGTDPNLLKSITILITPKGDHEMKAKVLCIVRPRHSQILPKISSRGEHSKI
jgi:hypothetical protein